VACLFPDAAITLNSSLSVFISGIERVIDEVDGVIVPFYLNGLWERRWSRATNSELRETTHQDLSRDISIIFGKPLAIGTPDIEVKQSIFELK